MPSNPRQAELLSLFEQTRALLGRFIATRSDAERATASARGVLISSALWFEYMVERMGFYGRGEPAPRHVDFDGLGRQALDAHAGDPWEALAASAYRGLDALIEAVRGFDDAALSVENVYGDPGDEQAAGPLWGEIRANGFIVPFQEAQRYLEQAGEASFAAEVAAGLRDALGEPEMIRVPLVEPGALLAELAGGGPVLIDVRGPKEFAAGHIRGAVNIPLGQLEKKLGALPADRPVVTYCFMHHPGQSRGERAAALLGEHGLAARAIAGGFTAWEAAGLPVERGR